MWKEMDWFMCHFIASRTVKYEGGLEEQMGIKEWMTKRGVWGRKYVSASRDVSASSELHARLKQRTFFSCGAYWDARWLGKKKRNQNPANTFYAARFDAQAGVAQFAPKGLLVASVSELFIFPVMSLISFVAFCSDQSPGHAGWLGVCRSLPHIYSPFPLDGFTLGDSSGLFWHQLSRMACLLLLFLSHPRFPPPRALKTSWSCQVTSSTTNPLMRAVNPPHPPYPVLNFHPVFILDPPFP